MFKHEQSIVLTCDIGLLKNKIVTRGYWVRHTAPEKQLIEILSKFDLYRSCTPFTRCIECNGLLVEIEKEAVEYLLLPDTKKYYEHFTKCSECKQIYREGTHYKKLQDLVNRIMLMK